VKKKTRILSVVLPLLIAASYASAQIVTENFSNPSVTSNAEAGGYLGSTVDTTGLNYNTTTSGWLYANANMGINAAAEGDGSGTNNNNGISSIGLARAQDERGSNARAISVIYAGSLFSVATEYTVSFDVIGDPSGTQLGRYWLAEVSGYDDTDVNFIQIDGTHTTWGTTTKPFTANGAAYLSFLADSEDNGVSIAGSSITGTTNVSFNFTYSAGTDIAFAVGTYNNIFAIDNFSISVSAVPEPSSYASIAGALALISVMVRRRR
jgi:hypothetical protein